MNINDTLFMYLNANEIAKKHRESKEGIRLEHLGRKLNCIAIELPDYYDDKNCCCEQNFRHFKFQCRSHKEYIIASYNRCDYAHLGMEQVEQFITLMAAYELETFIYEHEIYPIASKFQSAVTNILDYYLTNFKENIYVVDFIKRGMAAQESTHILQREDDESISLGMPMQPQEEDKEE
jgi:hypothetical protein